MKRVVRILRGLPATGKSTTAKAWQAAEPGRWKRVNKDALREMFDHGKHSKGNERFVIAARDALIDLALEYGYDVLVDDTNLNPVHIQDISGSVDAVANVEVHDFHATVEECIERDRKRANYVGEKVIRRMYNQWLRKPPESKPHDPDLPDCIIVDLDGTLALFGNANPYDRDFSQDKVNHVVLDILYGQTSLPLIASHPEPPEIIIVSGRNDKYLTVTENWLRDHLVPYNELYMRADGDFRPDVEVKRDIYDQFIDGEYNVLFVVDDRSRIVDLWRNELGLTCLQVADGDF